MLSTTKSVIDRKLLVTTALESTWGNDENLLFSGEWCKPYDQRHTWQERSYETILFHWEDRKKLKSDYDYLEDLHHTLLNSLTASLNNFHKVSYSRRCWQILLDPWLMAYVGVLFDRWEILRLVFDNNEHITTILPRKPESEEIPFSYTEFFTQTQSDEWNYLVFSRIIETYYLDKCTIQKKDFNLQRDEENSTSNDQRHGKILKKVSIFIDTFIGIISSHYKVVFLSSCFNLPSLVRISLAIKQMPRLFLKEFKFFDAKSEINLNTLDRNEIIFDFKPGNQFESFLKKSIIDNAPLSVIEGFSSLRNRASALKIKTQIVMTANEHWNEIFTKFWFVDQINKGVKFIVLEHGGSLPAYKELFNFEEDIADIRGTWFLPYHEKHVKVPPAKLANKFNIKTFLRKKPVRKFCSCIGNEQPKWVFRVHFYPMAAQCLTSFDWVLSLFNSLNDDIKKYFKVKPYPNVGWNTNEMFENALGAEKIANNYSLEEVFNESKVIICTYPETTFSEAMATGIPTILVYPEQYYERHSITDALLDLLRTAKLVFHDPDEAAEHLNTIWANPEVWWNTPDVLNARAEFTQQAISVEKNWLMEWKDFIGGVID